MWILLKLCECGCGQPTKLASKTAKNRGWIKGQPLRFINGHNTITREYSDIQIEKICEYCGSVYKIIPCRNDKTKFCSRSCTTSNRNKVKARKYGETTVQHGYLRIKLPDHPFSDKGGYVFYHRHIVESYFGYYIDPKEYDVHHIDENKLNNTLTNLVVIRHSAHMRLHALKRKFWELSPR